MVPRWKDPQRKWNSRLRVGSLEHNLWHCFLQPYCGVCLSWSADYQIISSHYKSLRLAWILSLIQSLFCMVANRMSSISAASSSSPVRVYTAFCGSRPLRDPDRNSCSLWMRKWYSIWSCKVLRLYTECVHKDLDRIY